MQALLMALVLLISSCGARAQISPPADLTDPPDTAMVTESGLVYSVLEEGSGMRPGRSDKVTVHYTGWTLDGSMFDSSVSKGRPGRFVVSDVIAGWTEALLLMKSGSKYRLWIPEALAYRGQSGFPAGTLVFDVALISVD